MATPTEADFRTAATVAALTGYRKYKEMLEHLDKAAKLSREAIECFQDAQTLESCLEKQREWTVPYRVDTVQDFYEKVVPHSAAFMRPIAALQAELASA